MKQFGNIQQRFVFTVMSMLILLTVTGTFAVVRMIQNTAYRDAAKGINRDASSYKTLHTHRIQELYTRARFLASEPKIIAALGTEDIDRETIKHLVKEIRSDGDLDLLIVHGRKTWNPVLAMKMLPAESEPEVSRKSLKFADSGGSILSIAGRDVQVVSAPVKIGEELYGYVYIGDFVRETAFQTLRPLIASDVILCVHAAGTSPRVMAMTFPVMKDPDLSDLMSMPAGESPIRTRLRSTGEDYLARRVEMGGGVTGLFFKSLSPVQASVRSAVTTALLIAMVFLIVSAVLVHFMSQSISRPILSLVENTKSFADGNLDVQAELGGPEELSRLAESFNRMARRIKDLVAREEMAKITLEERVKERTAELLEVNRLLVEAHHELKEQTSKMVRYEKLAGIGTLAAGIAHELNNPLAVIMGNTQLLYETVLDPRIKSKIGTIQQHSRRCADIVKSMLRFANQEGPMRTPVNPNLLIDLALELTAIGHGSPGIDIVKRYDDRIPMTLMDESLMEQVVINIVTNAFDAIHRGRGHGTLIVSTGVSAGRLHLKFTDDGPGIPPEVAPKIFDPFFTTKDVGQGRGLGLSVAHGIVEQHGGRIFVERTGPRGTTIAIDLPIVSTIPQLSDEAHPGPLFTQPEDRLKGKCVLVVDDESDIRDIMTSYLEHQGCEVLPASSGEEALRAVESRAGIDILFVDIRMSGMDGIQLYQRLLEMSPDLAGRIVFVTGDTLSQDIRRFLEKTRSASIIKPFKMQDLLKVAVDVLVRHAVAHGSG